jgi:predicted TIM-barrel fold metal-dependent hydrolase
MLRQRGMVKDLGKQPTEILSKIYVDTSGSPLNNIQLALDLFGEDKVLWGSDYPANREIRENLESLNTLDKNTRENITYKNFLNLFNL